MVYMIVRWLGVEGGWVILHYTHDFDDAYRMKQLYKERYGEVSLMLEECVVETHEIRQRLKQQRELVKKLQEEAKQREIVRAQKEYDTITAGNKTVPARD